MAKPSKATTAKGKPRIKKRPPHPLDEQVNRWLSRAIPQRYDLLLEECRLLLGEVCQVKRDPCRLMHWAPLSRAFRARLQKLEGSVLVPSILQELLREGPTKETAGYGVMCTGEDWSEARKRIEEKKRSEAWKRHVTEFEAEGHQVLAALQEVAAPPAPAAETLPNEGPWSEPNIIKHWAKRFRVHRNTMSKLLHSKKFHCKRHGRFWMIKVADLPPEKRS
jgi:hypothetical protein